MVAITVDKVPVSPLVYLISLTALMGWIIFSIFGGIGMVTLPIDLIKGFINRPKPIGQTE